VAELGWARGCSLAPGEQGRGALRAPFSPQEDCEFYLTAQRFIVLPMERQRLDSSDGYVPRGGLPHLPGVALALGVPVRAGRGGDVLLFGRGIVSITSCEGKRGGGGTR